MIYTSYFSNISSILERIPDAKFISIAGKTPSGIDCAKYEPLIPHWSWWKEWHSMFVEDLESIDSIAWYEKKYNSTVLFHLDPLKTAQEIKDLANWQPTILLCYESPKKFCHRHLVAKWLNSFRIDCEELDIIKRGEDE